jgi:hypothetical protein
MSKRIYRADRELAAAVSDTGGVLSTLRLFLRTRVDSCQQFPTHFLWVCRSLWCALKSSGSPVAYKCAIDLRRARSDVPRIAIDLMHVGHPPQVDENPPAIAAIAKEEIGLGLVITAWESTVVKFRKIAAIRIGLSVNEGERCFDAASIPQRHQHMFKLEASSRTPRRHHFNSRDLIAERHRSKAEQWDDER